MNESPHPMTPPPTKSVSWVSADGWRVIVARGLRNFGYGFTSVLLGVTLAADGFSTLEVGLLLTVALVGDMLSIFLVAWFADRVGRRRVLAFFSLLMAASGIAFALSQNTVVLLLAAFFGIISPSNSENTPFSTIEQAVLPQTTSGQRRTDVFARYNLVAQLAGAFGGLCAALPDVLSKVTGIPTNIGIRLMFAIYAVLAFVTLGIFLSMSSSIEPALANEQQTKQQTTQSQQGRLSKSRGIVLKLASLFALDAFAGGLAVQAILALWFHERFGVSLSLLGVLFFGTNLLSALSFLFAARLAKRIGLLNTMVFTHLPSNILLILVPLMPVFPLAACFLLCRQSLSQMDVPTRQAYTMTVVTPEERTAAASFTTLARSVALSVSPLLSGALLVGPAIILGLPFIFAGGLKIVYDLSLYGVFKHVHIPSKG